MNRSHTPFCPQPRLPLSPRCRRVNKLRVQRRDNTFGRTNSVNLQHARSLAVPSLEGGGRSCARTNCVSRGLVGPCATVKGTKPSSD